MMSQPEIDEEPQLQTLNSSGTEMLDFTIPTVAKHGLLLVNAQIALPSIPRVACSKSL
jgi:hypothetical protein